MATRINSWDILWSHCKFKLTHWYERKFGMECKEQPYESKFENIFIWEAKIDSDKKKPFSINQIESFHKISKQKLQISSCENVFKTLFLFKNLFAFSWVVWKTSLDKLTLFKRGNFYFFLFTTVAGIQMEKITDTQALRKWL